MTLLHPIYLWSLLLLIIPIAVHLFSKKNPPRIKIGSIKFLERAESRTFRRLKLHDALLFALRATIFLLLSILTASPKIACNDKVPQTGWMLIEPNVSLEEQPAECHRAIDSLVNAGYEMHVLETNFPTISGANEKSGAMDLWSLLAEADEINRDTLAFFVASTRRESSLQGKRPTLSREVKWIEVRAEETIWIERIAQLSDDSLFIVIGTSSPSETRFGHLIAPIPDRTMILPPIELTRKNDSIGVALISKPSEKKWFSLTKTKQWCIVYDEHFEKTLPYLERAVKAIAHFAPVKISVEVKKQTEWKYNAEQQLIWLSKNAPPEHPKCLDARGFSAEAFLDQTAIHTLSEELLPEEVSKADVRKVSSEIATPITRFYCTPDEAQWQSLSFIIWIFVTCLVGLERWIAFSKD